MILVIGALLGFISMAFGAYAEHGVRATLSEEDFHLLMTAVRYHQIHAIVIVAIGLVILNGGKLADMRTLHLCALLFIVGTLLFSFSIYLSISLDIPGLVRVAFIGGIMMMLAWLLLAITGILTKNRLCLRRLSASFSSVQYWQDHS